MKRRSGPQRWEKHTSKPRCWGGSPCCAGTTARSSPGTRRVARSRIVGAASAFGAVDGACTCRRRCLHAAVFERLAELDPEEALRRADQIPDSTARGIVLAHAIPRVAVADPQRAMELVKRVPELHEKIQTWVDLCAALADSHPERAVLAAENAEGNARFAHQGLVQLSALTSVARSLHRVDPARAGELLAAAEAVFDQLEPSHSRSLTAVELACAQAGFDPERAGSTARQIAHPYPRALAFVLLAEDAKTSLRRH